MPQLPFKRETAAELLRDSETLGTTILTILLAAYGEQVFLSDVLELYAMVQEDFRATISEEGENRLNALLLALGTDGFYEDPNVFLSVATALYDGDLGDMVDGILEDLTIPEILWAIYEVGLLRDDEIDFSPAVQSLIDRTIADEAEEEDMEAAQAIPYFERFVDEAKFDLATQLSKLGVDRSALQELV